MRMDIVDVHNWAIRLMFVGPLVVAAYTDITRYRISNTVCLAMLALFPLAQCLTATPAPWAAHILTALAALGLCFLLFIPGLLGGGDAKLLAVCGLWLGPAVMPAALVLTAVTGGILCLLLIALRARLAARVAVLEKDGPIPYGLAIAAAGVLLSGRLPLLTPP